MKCEKCGKIINEHINYCDNCGNKIEYTVPQKTIIDKLVTTTMLLVIIVLGLYVIISCLTLTSSPKTDGSVSGLYVIFGIPFGLVLCDFFPIINYLMNRSNAKKNSITSLIIGIILNCLTILGLHIFYSNFINNLEKNALYYICIVSIIISAIMILAKMLKNIINN